MPVPTRLFPPLILLVTLGSTLTAVPATARAAMESSLPVYCLAPDGIVQPQAPPPGYPGTTITTATTDEPYWFVGLSSDPTTDVSDVLSYRDGENYGIHPGGFGSMTENGALTFDALGFSGSTTQESNTGDIRFLGTPFRNERSLYIEAESPAFYMYIGPSPQIIDNYCTGIFYDSLGIERVSSDVYWSPAYRSAALSDLKAPAAGSSLSS